MRRTFLICHTSYAYLATGAYSAQRSSGTLARRRSLSGFFNVERGWARWSGAGSKRLARTWEGE